MKSVSGGSFEDTFCIVDETTGASQKQINELSME
jgi:hypothetical protein